MRHSIFTGIALAANLLCIPLAEGQGSIPGCFDCQPLDIAQAPKYRIARRYKEMKTKLILYVSIRNNKFTPADLSALACRIDKDFKSDGDVLVFIFDNPKSAKRYRYRAFQERPAGWEEDEKALRAIYIRDAAKAMNSIAWFVDPFNKTGEISRSLCGVTGSAATKVP